MAKLTEKQLYETWLNIHYANDLNKYFVQDMNDELKLLRKYYKKTQKLLKQASDHYKSIYGKEPKIEKR